MKILVATGCFLPDIGGIETLLGQLLPVIAQRHEVSVIASHYVAELPDLSTHKQIPVRRFPIIATIYNKQLIEMVRIRKQIEKLIADLQPDLIHCHLGGLEIAIYAQVCKKLSIPIVVTLHNQYDKFGFTASADSFLGQILQEATWVTAVSDGALDWARQNFVGIEQKSSVIRNAIALPSVAPAPLPSDPQRLMFIGRLVHQKGLDILIDAFALIHGQMPTVELWLVGDGELRAALKEQVAQLSLSAAVTFVGAVKPEEVPTLLNQATIVVMPSRNEGMPMAAIEAAAMARPIVATRAAGMPQVVKHNESGLLIDEQENPEAVAQAVLTLLRDTHIATDMGKRGREHIKQNFLLPSCVDAYEALYDMLLANVQQP